MIKPFAAPPYDDRLETPSRRRWIPAAIATAFTLPLATASVMFLSNASTEDSEKKEPVQYHIDGTYRCVEKLMKQVEGLDHGGWMPTNFVAGAQVDGKTCKITHKEGQADKLELNTGW